jgi:secondary thiamine-phosphate synthase enzyme
MSDWRQVVVRLAPRPRGIHLVTHELLGAIDLGGLDIGMVHCFVRHTSAALSLNENASPEVRTDLAQWLDRAAPDGANYFAHTLEGPDDMAAHVKASMIGVAVTLPISRGRPLLGTWQGIYLCEFRDRAGSREVVVTAWGAPAGGSA